MPSSVQWQVHVAVRLAAILLAILPAPIGGAARNSMVYYAGMTEMQHVLYTTGKAINTHCIDVLVKLADKLRGLAQGSYHTNGTAC